MSNFKVPCCGVIVLSQLKDGQTATIFVASKTWGNMSFPKGKREKGETDLQCALRELNEESGLTEDQIKLREGWIIDEISDRGNPNVRYFVADLILKDGEVADDIEFHYDPEEIQYCRWFPVIEVPALERLKNSRKDVLRKVLARVSEKE